MEASTEVVQPFDWSSITIRDNYMFATVFSDPELCRELLEAILRKPIAKVVIVSSEVGKVPELGAKGIRMDVYVADEVGTVYDVEMQNANEGNLAKRSRYYLSANDLDCMTPGMDYRDMRDSYVVFVCSFDPFGRKLPKYEVTPHCKEDHVEMPDGAERIFVNAKAWAKCDDKRLSCFLRYLGGGTIGDDDFTRRVDEMVRQTRRMPEWRRNRMKLERYISEQTGKAYREGRNEGRKEGRALIMQLAGELAAAGRADEFMGAIEDDQLLDGLLAEFGMGQQDEE